jgi:hypothetical protein
MPTIQQVIAIQNAQFVAATEKAMLEHLHEFKKSLIETLAEKFEFEVDEAMELFPVEEVTPVEKPKKKKKAKKAKDPNAPKRPTTAYFFFMKDKRPEVSAEFPDLKTTEITSKLGAMWQLIKDSPEALPYNELNSTDKTRYEAEMLLYSPPSSPTDSD